MHMRYSSFTSVCLHKYRKVSCTECQRYLDALGVAVTIELQVGRNYSENLDSQINILLISRKASRE